MKRILVLCTHNSARSQMAEGWLRHYSKELGVELKVYSAGIERKLYRKNAIFTFKNTVTKASITTFLLFSSSHSISLTK